jgi:hypothetical protein
LEEENAHYQEKKNAAEVSSSAGRTTFITRSNCSRDYKEKYIGDCKINSKDEQEILATSVHLFSVRPLSLFYNLQSLLNQRLDVVDPLMFA